MTTLDPSRCADKTTYVIQAIAIAPGDQLRWTRNDAQPGVRNGQIVTVESIDRDGTATLKAANGKTMTYDLTGQQYLDYSLVSTTYGSQGKTADQVLVAVDRTISKEGLYVAVSRAKQHLSLYTADKAQLFKQAERSTAKENPSDVLTLFNLVNPDAQREKAARPTRDVPSRNRAEHAGHHIGGSVAGGHRAATRRDRAAEARSEGIARAAIDLHRSTSQVTRGISHLSHSSTASEGLTERAATAASEQLAAVVSRRQHQLEQAKKWDRRRAAYRAFAEHVGGGVDIQDQDQKVAQQVLIELTRERSRYSLTPADKQKAEAIMRASPEAERLAQSSGEEAAQTYVIERLTQANRQIVEQVQQKEKDGLEL